MSVPIKTFVATVECSRGWPYETALVAVRHASATSQDTYVSEDCTSEYKTDSLVDTIAYRANFWGTKAIQQKGLPSQGLINPDNEEDPTLFTVDLDHYESVKVRSSTMSPVDQVFRLIELDVNRRFPQ